MILHKHFISHVLVCKDININLYINHLHFSEHPKNIRHLCYEKTFELQNHAFLHSLLWERYSITSSFVW